MQKVTGYRRTYRLRNAVPGKKSIEVTFPYEVVERQAREHGMSVPEFLERYQAIAQYDNFEGVHYTFEPIPENDKDKGSNHANSSR